MTYDEFTHAMHAGMAKMMRDMHAAGPSNNPDVDFLAMMIPHHEGAVEMAKVLKLDDNYGELSKLADDVIRTQTAEIDQMKAWLRAWSATQK